MKAPISQRLLSILTVFSLAFPLIYTVAYYNEWALFRFYPLVGQVHFDAQPTTFGPAMIYYNWIVAAGLSALGVALAVPSRWVVHLWAGWSWLIPLAATVFTFIYETRWLMH
jgi:hypothetical protein